MLANMAQSTIKGRAAAAGTGDPTDLTPAQVGAILTLTGGAADAVLAKASAADMDFVWSSAASVSSGTFTPTIAGSTTAGAHTYATQQGYYFKIGSLVFINLYVAMSAKDAAMAGNAQIHGLPFTTRNVSNEFPLGNVIFRSVNLDAAGGFYSTYGNILSNNTKIALGQQGDNVVQKNIVAADIAATTAVFLSAWYVAA
jgi:hypothetical protein